ncbi:uncharacterized protein BO66DRAFT_310521, partial [Aspergillus aculeatinus CBS 121060]
LHDFCHIKELPHHGSESIPTSNQRQATIALLQPLGNTDILESCRRARAICPSNSAPNSCRDAKNKFLNFDPLSETWRQEMMKRPPYTRLVFDRTLPPRGIDNSPEIYWDHKMPEKVRLTIRGSEVITLPRTFASTTVIRAKGEVVSFDALFDPEAGVSVRSVKVLKSQFVALGQTRETAEVNRLKNSNAGVAIEG